MLDSKKNRIILIASAAIIIILVAFALLRDTSKEASLQQVKSLIEENKIEHIVQSDGYFYIKTPTEIYRIGLTQVSPELLENYAIEVDKESSYLLYIVFSLIVLGVLSYVGRYWMKQQQAESGRPMPFASLQNKDESSQNITPVESDVTFDDIGGIADVKQELQEIIDFLRNPSRFKSFGARMPRGVLLIGPPGVGKTMIAKAVAAEAGVPFYYQSAASFVQIYVGMGAKRVHELFSAAKNNSPSIIFIDEIDAVGKERDGNRSDEREATLNQLLTEMDGFEDSSGVIVVAATNKIDVLDAALLRAGRFDRRIFVELPTPIERKAIINTYLSKVPHSLDVDEIVQMSVGFNGASLAALVNEAALMALREHEMQVSMDHFYAVKDKVAYGKKKLSILSTEQKQFRARYLAGKAALAYAYRLPFEKVMLSSETIKPQMDAPMIQSEIEAHIKVLLGGMAACDIHFSEHASNVQNDLKQAKKMALEMVDLYGMGKGVVASEQEDITILDRLYQETKSRLAQLEPALVAIEEVLMRKESITKEHIGELMADVL